MIESNISPLDAWFTKYNIQLQKVNVREWGSYEIALSNNNGQAWAVIPGQLFGWGFKLEESAREALTTIMQTGNVDVSSLNNWLGAECATDLLAIFKS